MFQPVVAIAGTTVAHWEALTRFHAEPDLSPRMRLKSGAELEMLPVFDLAVARQVVATLAGMPKDRGTVLAINLSAPSLRHPDLIQHLLAIVSARGFPPGRLILEIPTDVDGADWDGVRRFVTAARFLGFGVCLDDFSCDGPSLRCLSEIDIDQVKLDGAQFFRDGASRRELIMLRAFVDMAQQLGIATIAKLVDTPDKREQARSFGFDMVQGHLSGAPRNRPRD